MTASSPLQEFQRHVTAHNDDGTAVFCSTVPPVSFGNIGPAKVSLGWATESFPSTVDNGQEDVKAYNNMLQNPPGLVISTGTVLRIVDMPPGHMSPMHRTVSLDYCVCMGGSVELLLDSGEIRRLQTGDIVVQRGTMHQWKNTSNTEWVRMLYVLTPVVPVKIGEKILEEDYGWLVDVRRSE